MNIKDFYFNLSIRYKIIIFFFSVVLIISLGLGFYSYGISEKSVITKVSAANLEVIKQINSNLNFLQEDITDISTYIAIDSTVQSTLISDYSAIESSTQDQLFIDNSLKFIMNLIASKSYISMVTLYGDNGFGPYNIITDMSTGLNSFSLIKRSDIYRKAKTLEGSPLWVPIPKGTNVFLQNNKNPKVVLCRTIKNISTNTNIGFLFIGINEQYIKNICERSIQTSRESLLIIDNEGNPISKVGSDPQSLFDTLKNQKILLNDTTGSLIESMSNKDYVITYSNLNRLGWKVFYSVPKENLTKEINSIKFLTWGIILACMFLFLPLAVFISNYLTAPIRKLLKSMKSFQEGNFDERVQFKYNDEIGELGAGYNSMVSNIKELIDKAYVLQIKEREAELDALQAQINPHFLYNTLDTIFWKAERQGQKEISDMVFSLSKLFRLSLNRGRGQTSIEKEKELIEHYLTLQKMRFKEKLNYEINIDNNILKFLVPKLLLQPFVENAILHGIEDKESGGTVKVTGSLENGKIRFIIEDDGVGMDQATIDRLLSQSYDAEPSNSMLSGGYAIKNINERLRLNFNDDYSMEFRSTPGQGTAVVLTIPSRELSDR